MLLACCHRFGSPHGEIFLRSVPIPLYSADYLKVLIDHITVRLIRSDLIVFYIVQSASTRSVFFLLKS